jgi:hypothetical protein
MGALAYNLLPMIRTTQDSPKLVSVLPQGRELG